jgi:putative spermidine/putrescine transport system permease protein
MKPYRESFWNHFLLAFLAVIIIGPFLLLLIKSIAVQWRWPSLIPDEFIIRAWGVVFTDPKILEAIQTSITMTVIVIVITLGISMPAARTMAYFNFKGKSLIDTVLMLPLLIPLLVVVMGLHLTMIRYGLADTLFGVILVHLIPTIPYAFRILRNGYERIGRKWSEQAAILGARPMQRFWTITLPLLMPSIRSAVVLTSVISLSQYALTAIIGGGIVTTLPMLYYPYFNSADQGVMAAFTVLFALLPLLFWGMVELGCKWLTTLIKQT